MKKLLCFVLLVFGTSVMADSYECYPEVGSGAKVELNIDFVNGVVSLELVDRGLFECANTRFNENGDVTDYGRAALDFDCRGHDILFVREYAEKILDLGHLAGQLGLTKSVYMCE